MLEMIQPKGQCLLPRGSQKASGSIVPFLQLCLPCCFYSRSALPSHPTSARKHSDTMCWGHYLGVIHRQKPPQHVSHHMGYPSPILENLVQVLSTLFQIPRPAHAHPKMQLAMIGYLSIGVPATQVDDLDGVLCFCHQPGPALAVVDL